MMDKVIVCTLYKRPGYTARLLDALAQCYGIQDYEVLFAIDYEKCPACDQVVRLADHWIASPASYFIHEPKLGIDVNKLDIFPIAFGLTDYVIHFEDDIIPARDCLRFLEWAGTLQTDPTVLAVSAYQKDAVFSDPANPARPLGVYDAYRGTGGFAVWGWATWYDRWQQVIGDESAYRAFAKDQVNGKFDWWWKHYMDQQGMFQVHPFVSRCQNLVGKPGAPDEGVNSKDELSWENYNPEGAWLVPDLPDPPRSVWSLK